MKLIYSNFKVTNNLGKGFWVSLRELNYMLNKGVISVDSDALEKYMDTVIPELSIAHMYDDYDMTDEMVLSPNDEDRRLFNVFYEAGKKLRREMNEELNFTDGSNYTVR